MIHVISFRIFSSFVWANKGAVDSSPLELSATGADLGAETSDGGQYKLSRWCLNWDWRFQISGDGSRTDGGWVIVVPQYKGILFKKGTLFTY